ncbi:hypothetical protein E2320_000129 [Naja naja]|nr:hypothetical protein E2320_000129 [Naja naja]
MLGRTQFSQKSYLVTKSSNFGNKLIFMLPRVENIENPLHFWISALPEELSQGIFQNVVVENFENPLHFHIRAFPDEISQGICQNGGSIQPENITFDSELGFRKEAYFHVAQSSVFEKNIIFIFPRVENVENPLYFRMWALPEELAPVNCKSVRVENFENPLHFRSRVFPEELSQGKSQNVVWNSIQAENITFDSELGFRKEAYFHLTEGGKRFKIHFIFRSELSLKNFENKLIFMLPMGKTLKIHIIFHSGLSLRS